MTQLTPLHSKLVAFHKELDNMELSLQRASKLAAYLEHNAERMIEDDRFVDVEDVCKYFNRIYETLHYSYHLREFVNSVEGFTESI